MMTDEFVTDGSAAAQIPVVPKGDTARFGRDLFPAAQMNELQRQEFAEALRRAMEEVEEAVTPASDSEELDHTLAMTRSRMDDAEGGRPSAVPQSVMDHINQIHL